MTDDDKPYAKGIQGILKRLEYLDKMDEREQLETCKEFLDAAGYPELNDDLH